MPIDITHVFGPWVTGVSDETCPWSGVGARRTVHLLDGGQFTETLTAYQPSAHFAYRLHDWTGLLRLLVHEAHGSWWFNPVADGGTELIWSYRFLPRSRWTSPLLRLVWWFTMGRAFARVLDHADG